MSTDEYESIVADPSAAERFAGTDAVHLLVVDGDPARLPEPGSLPVVVCSIGDRFGGPGPAGADLVVADADVGALTESIQRSPLASVSLALLLRASDRVDIDRALALESATYSMLQQGPEFAAWRSGTEPTRLVDDEPVLTRRVVDELTIVLDRPHRHNAITTHLRDELYEALSLAVVDDSITSVVLRGAGPSFCSGGDLAEFGSRPDPVGAHRTRLARSPARLIHRLRHVLVARVHGSALGGGIEMVAFAGRVVADPGATFALPEIAIGLIPGAGGTVSLPRRIGRQRTAALALTGRTIDTSTALEWGLIDEISPIRPADAS